MAQIKSWVQAHWKAIGGALAAGGYALIQSSGEGITGDEWRNIAIATLAGAGITWVFPANKTAAHVGGED